MDWLTRLLLLKPPNQQKEEMPAVKGEKTISATPIWLWAKTGAFHVAQSRVAADWPTSSLDASGDAPGRERTSPKAAAAQRYQTIMFYAKRSLPHSSEVSGNAKNLSPIDDGGEDKAFLTKVGNSTL